jgi:DNA-directed RNA polymerase subunit RPC12/RpoP
MTSAKVCEVYPMERFRVRASGKLRTGPGNVKLDRQSRYYHCPGCAARTLIHWRKDRCLLFRAAAGGRLIHVDDVIAEPIVAAVELVDDRPVYRDRNGDSVTVEPNMLGVD